MTRIAYRLRNLISHERSTSSRRAGLLGCAAIVACISGGIGASQPTAASNLTAVTILEIAIDPAYGNFVFIRVSTPPTGTSCGTNGYWHFTLPFTNALSPNPTGAQQYAALLSAQMAGKTISITGTGTCNETNTVESLRGINVQS